MPKRTHSFKIELNGFLTDNTNCPATDIFVKLAFVYWFTFEFKLEEVVVYFRDL